MLTRLAEPVASGAPPSLPGVAGEAFGCAVQGRAYAAPDPLPAGDAGLWWAIVDPNARQGAAGLFNVGDEGPLLAPDQFLAIEVWTESELSSLHALTNLAMLEGSAEWRARAVRARDWHLEHTQPDNATGRPWAIHTFILAGTPEGEHYAETLLHNAVMLTGTPDVTSAWILIDAARGLCTSQQVAESTLRRRVAWATGQHPDPPTSTPSPSC